VTGRRGDNKRQSPCHAFTPSPRHKRLNGRGIRFHEMGGWMVELIFFGSDPAVVDLSGKPFCSHLFHPSYLDTNQTKKNPPASCSSLCRSIRGHLWSQISDSTSATIFVSGDGLETFQRSGADSRPEFSQRPCCSFIHDGNPPRALVPPLSNPFLPRRCIHRMDPNLPGRSLSHGCHRGSPVGIRNHKGFFVVLFTFSCTWNTRCREAGNGLI
jgi:hypothetical protein